MVNYNLLFIMSISGSMVFLVYVISYPVMQRFSTPQWRYRQLKLTALFFLLPLPDWAFNRIHDLEIMFLNPQKHLSIQYLDFSKTILRDGSDFYIPLKIQLGYLSALITCIIAMVLFAYRIYRYWKGRKFILSDCNEISSAFFEERLSQLHLHRKIKFYCSAKIHSPFTLGIFRPVVIIPEDMKNDDGYHSSAISHELVHIKNWDMAVKMLGLLTICVHWFNPLSYLFYRELKVMCEICCDAAVIAGFEQNQKRQYFAAMLGVLKKPEYHHKMDFVLDFISGDYKIPQRRLKEMKFLKRKKRNVLAVCMMAVACLATLPASLAYAPPSGWEVDSIEDVAQGKISHEFTPDGVEPSARFQIQPLPCDNFFTDENGNIYEITEPQVNKKVCAHSYVTGTDTEHNKKSNGGCTVIVYSAKRCTKCGDIIRGEVLSEQSFKPCPH